MMNRIVTPPSSFTPDGLECWAWREILDYRHVFMNHHIENVHDFDAEIALIISEALEERKDNGI